MNGVAPACSLPVVKFGPVFSATATRESCGTGRVEAVPGAQIVGERRLLLEGLLIKPDSSRWHALVEITPFGEGHPGSQGGAFHDRFGWAECVAGKDGRQSGLQRQKLLGLRALLDRAFTRKAPRMRIWQLKKCLGGGL